MTNILLFQSKDGASPFVQMLHKYLSHRTLSVVAPWLDSVYPPAVLPYNFQHADESEQHMLDGASLRETLVYRPVLPQISDKPLSTFVQVSPDPQAARRVFGTSIGFFWLTIENNEAMCDINFDEKKVTNDIQSTMSLAI